MAFPNRRLQYVRHPFPPDICRHVSLLPTGLAEAAISSNLSVQCIQLLASVAQWAPLVETPKTQPEQIIDPQTRYCRLFCEPRECSRDAVNLLLCLKRSGLPSGIEHVICLGLAIAIRHLSGENRTNIFDTASLEALNTNIKAIDTPTVPESEVIIWISLVTNWRTQCRGPLRRADDLLDYVVDSFPVSRSWGKLVAICRKFWWFECFQEDWEKCWRRGMERYHSRETDENSNKQNY